MSSCNVHSLTFAVASSESSRAEACVVIDVVSTADSVNARLESFTLVDFSCNKTNTHHADVCHVWQW